ncbi:MAG: hypothetical protein II948_09860 [Synergistaceae bacterium]|nr:hypothetical protein [Synergistaceae bacterium]
MKNIFISCGEPSGDLYAVDFASALLKLDNNLKIWGMYGPKTEKILNNKAVWSYEELKLMGFLEVLPAIPRILRLRRNIIEEVLKNNSDCAVLIDCPDFNLLLASGLRKAGFKNKIISLIPPTVWAWRSGRVKNLKRDFDLCLPLFKFEHEFLIAHNAKSLWAAHPLVGSIKNFQAAFKPDNLLKKFGDNNKLIALMPGSRRYDIKFHLDTLIKTAKILKADNYLPVFSIAPGLSPNLAEELRTRVREAEFEYWDGEGRELMSIAQAVAGVSGTVAVEAMLLKKFMAVIYNLNKFTYFILKRLVKAKYISTPNYMTERQIFPELLCGDANPERIINELYNYLNNKDIKLDIDNCLERAKFNMGDINAAEFWAQCVMNLI